MLFMLAGLVSYSAGCLAGRLAGCLAFAAATRLNRLVQPLNRQCLNMLHGNTSYNKYHGLQKNSLSIIPQSFKKEKLKLYELFKVQCLYGKQMIPYCLSLFVEWFP